MCVHIRIDRCMDTCRGIYRSMTLDALLVLVAFLTWMWHDVKCDVKCDVMYDCDVMLTLLSAYTTVFNS